MPCAVTAREIDELEELLKKFHGKHASNLIPLEKCTHETCMDAKLGVAWLRAQLVVDRFLFERFEAKR
jgi:hypothetical protein